MSRCNLLEPHPCILLTWWFHSLQKHSHMVTESPAQNTQSNSAPRSPQSSPSACSRIVKNMWCGMNELHDAWDIRMALTAHAEPESEHCGPLSKARGTPVRCPTSEAPPALLQPHCFPQEILTAKGMHPLRSLASLLDHAPDTWGPGMP